MSLIQEQEMTDKNRAAHGANGRKSRGAATPEGKERARAANLRHGVYSKLRDEALPALGEDPAHLDELKAEGYRQWRPTNPDQAWYVERMASLKFRLERYERMQETVTARRIRRVDDRRLEAVRQVRIKYAELDGFLLTLEAAVARPDFYAPPGFFPFYENAAKVGPCPEMARIGELLSRLREPADSPAPGATPDRAMSDAEWKLWRESFAAKEYPVPCVLPVAQGQERDEMRAELEEIARSQRALNAESWEKELDRQGAPLPLAERDAMAREMGKEIEFLVRQENICSRELARTAKLFLQMQAAEERKSQAAARAEAEAASRNATAATAAPPPGPDTEAAPPLGPDTEAGPGTRPGTPENKGASGYVDENTTPAKAASAPLSAVTPAGNAQERAAVTGPAPQADAAAPARKERGPNRAGHTAA